MTDTAAATPAEWCVAVIKRGFDRRGHWVQTLCGYQRDAHFGAVGARIEHQGAFEAQARGGEKVQP